MTDLGDIVDNRRAAQPGTGPKVDPEEIAIRAQPRPVTRINRRILILLSGTGLLLILGATMFALDPPRLLKDDDTGRGLIRTENTRPPEGLEALPRKYSDMPRPPIQLGPPLTGDIGPVVVSAERDLGIAAPGQMPFRPSPEDDAVRAERIRQARLAQQGRESGVFFQLSSRTAGGGNALPRSIAEIARSAGEGARSPFNIAGGDAVDGLGLDLQNDQNLQGRKLDFLGEEVESAIYNPHRLQDPASPYQLMSGTVIAASLITGINSDLPGRVIAQVTENIYDTVSGLYVLIPQGSRVIGSYDSVIAFGQERALVVWQRIIMPDGSSIVIENLPATDTAGYAGLADEVNFHTWRLLQGVALSTLLGVSTEITFGNDEGDLVQAIRQSTQNSVNQAGQRITERNFNIQPTITVRPGWPLKIIVNKDMVLRPYRDLGAIR